MTKDSGRSGAVAPSGLRPDGLSQSSLSQAEPLVPNAAERWTFSFCGSPPAVTVWAGPPGLPDSRRQLAYFEFTSTAERASFGVLLKVLAREHNAVLDAARIVGVAEAIERLEWRCQRAEYEYPRLAVPDGTVAVPIGDLRLALNTASGMSASGQDAQRLEAKPASPTGEAGDAP